MTIFIIMFMLRTVTNDTHMQNLFIIGHIVMSINISLTDDIVSTQPVHGYSATISPYRKHTPYTFSTSCGYRLEI